MQRLSIAATLLVVACSKGASKNENTPSAAASATAAVVAAPPSAPSAVRAWYVGTWKGEFAAARRASATTTKQGAPGAWEKDSGQKFSGPGTIEIGIDDTGQVLGTIKGALGELGLRGRIDGEDLRANVVPTGEDPTTIQHGTVILARDSDALKGSLAAGSGDSMAMRQAEVALTKAAP